MSLDPHGFPWETEHGFFLQEGSYIAPVDVPAVGPFDSPLVALPCVNKEWARLILGAVDQLRNPSTWRNVTEMQLASVLQDVDELKGQLGQWGACVNPLVNVTLDTACGLVLTFADGSVVRDPGWTSNFCNCVKGCIPPLPPPNPGSTPFPQAACNTAGYLAQRFLQECLIVAHSSLVAGNDVLHYFQQLAADIATGNPFLEVLVTVSNDLYPTVQAQPIADVETAATDPLLLSDVTCIIFNCIKGVGWLEASNFACVAPQLAVIPYHLTWVPVLLANAWTNAGLLFLEQLQAGGALDNVDCSGCATWCRHQDLTITDGGWTLPPAPFNQAHYVGGSGWHSGSNGTIEQMGLILSLGGTFTVDNACFWMQSPTANSTANPRFCAFLLGGGVVRQLDFANIAYPGITELCADTDLTGGAVVCDTVEFLWLNDGTTQEAVLSRFQLYGHGTAPTFGDACP